MDRSAGEREGSQKKGLESVKNQRRRPRKEPLLQYRKLIWKEGCLRKRERKTAEERALQKQDKQRRQAKMTPIGAPLLREKQLQWNRRRGPS